MVSGVIFGVVHAFSVGDNAYVAEFSNTTPESAYILFSEALLKYSKTPVIIWFLAFIPLSSLLSFVLMFIKGAGLGFSTALLLRFHGTIGITNLITLYFIQNLFLIPSYIYISVQCLKFAAVSINPRVNVSGGKLAGKFVSKTSVFGIKPGRLTEYSFSLALSVLLVLAAALVEAFITPLFF